MFLGFCVYALLQEHRKDRIPALLYHRFISKDDYLNGRVKESDRVYVCYDTALQEQMEYLDREGYTTISLQDLIDCQQGKRSLPKKPIIITCDDGFSSNYKYAFPIWKRLGMKATIFVTPDVTSENFRKYAESDSPLSHEQLQEMSAYGISIESHGMTHRYLTELESQELQWELRESKRALEKITRTPVKFLAIPSGAYNGKVKKCAQAAGYRAVFCMLKGSNNLRSNPFALRRVVIAREYSLKDFILVLQPITATQLRLSSFFQDALMRLLGPKGLDQLRDWIYASPLGAMFVQGQFRLLVAGLGTVGIVVIILGVVFLI